MPISRPRRLGLVNVHYDRDRLDDARDQAKAWIDRNPNLEIVSINTSLGRMLAVVTVWYRDP